MCPIQGRLKMYRWRSSALGYLGGTEMRKWTLDDIYLVILCYFLNVVAISCELVKVQTFSSHPRPTEFESVFNEISKSFIWTFYFKKQIATFIQYFDAYIFCAGYIETNTTYSKVCNSAIQPQLGVSWKYLSDTNPKLESPWGED